MLMEIDLNTLSPGNTTVSYLSMALVSVPLFARMPQVLLPAVSYYVSFPDTDSGFHGGFISS